MIFIVLGGMYYELTELLKKCKVDLLISQIINAISKIFQKILKFLNGTGISKSLVLTLAGVLPVVNWPLNLGELLAVILWF